jgi:putative zinc finger protein
MRLYWHKSTEPVKAYLLGDADPVSAEALEKRYFTDPRFLRWVGEVEGDLISDYLDGQLSATERERFEARYLASADLRQRIEEVRNGGARNQRAAARLRWVVASSMLAIGLAGIVIWQAYRNWVPAAPLEGLTPALEVTLIPGLIKSGSTRQVEFTTPGKGRLQLSFELPAATGPVDCVVRLTKVGDAGERVTVWTSPILHSQAVAGRQAVTAEVDSSVIRPADYIAEVNSPVGTLRETYSFRVNAQ